MDVNTGHLMSGEGMQVMRRLFEAGQVRIPHYDEETTAMLKALDEYIPVPDELNRAAQIKLAGKPEAMVSLTSGGKLSKWAAGQRKERAREKKQKRQMAKESKRRNRG